ncbi:olfactory receptor 12D1-like [Rhea pennata]|uniref:olfactory receptor 12D1-like n=1 Tax=Rhea pennata TaxID=8795 RepID=UPI002E27429A
MEKVERDSGTSTWKFLLLGMGNVPSLQTPLFLLLLMIYLVTVVGNILIIVLVVTDQHRHTPMYYFLGSLSSLENCYSSTILPWLLASFLTGDRTISARGCIAQLHLFGSFAASECYLLAVMSYDWFLLLGIMETQDLQVLNFLLFLSIYLAALMGNSLIITAVTCNHRLHTPMYFFLLNLSILDLGSISTTVPKSMANSFTGTFAHLKPSSISSLVLDLVVAVLYMVVPPAANPLIYTMKNKELKEALSKLIKYLQGQCQ